MRVVCILLSPGAAVQNLAECCLRLSPQVAVGEHWIFLEIGKCTRLYTEDTVLKRIRVLLSKFGMFAHLAVADDIPTALAFARYQNKNKSQLPVRALLDYLNPFQYADSLNPMLGQLNKLGVYTIEDFQRLPRSTLVGRFGKEGLLAAQFLAEAERILWPHFKIKERIEESLALHQAPLDIEPLLFHIKTLTDRVASRLLGRGERASRFQLFIHQEKFSHVSQPLREFSFDLPLAQSTSLSLLSLIRERLNTQLSQTPLQSEVERIQLKVVEAVPLKTSQRDFLNRDEEERELWGGLIARLEEKLGRDSAFVALPVDTHIPEKSWRRGRDEWDRQNVGLHVSESLPLPPPRPLRIFADPLPLQREGAALFEQMSNLSWEIEAIHGPERIREEWWYAGSERDYYRIQTRSGEKLWVFQRPEQEGLFLHGSFD